MRVGKKHYSGLVGFLGIQINLCNTYALHPSTVALFFVNINLIWGGLERIILASTSSFTDKQ